MLSLPLHEDIRGVEALKLNFEEISYKYVNCHKTMYSDGL